MENLLLFFEIQACHKERAGADVVDSGYASCSLIRLLLCKLQTNICLSQTYNIAVSTSYI